MNRATVMTSKRGIFWMPFALQSPLSREECVRRLRAAADLEDRNHFTYAPAPRSEVRGFFKGGVYHLSSRSWMRREMTMEMLANHQEEGGGTTIQGSTLTGAATLMSAGGAGLLFIFKLLFIAQFPAGLFFGGFLAALCGWAVWREERDGRLPLIDFLKATLEAEEGDRGRTGQVSEAGTGEMRGF